MISHLHITNKKIERFNSSGHAMWVATHLKEDWLRTVSQLISIIILLLLSGVVATREVGWGLLVLISAGKMTVP